VSERAEELAVGDGRVARVDLVMSPAELPRPSQDETVEFGPS
jgi:hypothetical protein